MIPENEGRPPGRDRPKNHITTDSPKSSRWCTCRRHLHELQQFRATRRVSTPWYGGELARAHAEGRCGA
jgi:hypothetical protein